MMIRHVLFFLLAMSTACSSMRGEYYGLVEVEDVKNKEKKKYEVRYAESFDTTVSAIACGVTAFFYGGWCWSYLARPFSSEDYQLSSTAGRKMKAKWGNRYHLISEDSYVDSWSYYPPNFSAVEVPKDDLSKRKRSIYDVEHRSGHSMPRSRYVLGGVLSIVPGFGVGHAVQGRWLDGGHKFTWLPFGIMAIAISSCAGNTVENCFTNIFFGFMGITGVRIWEIVDAWSTPTFNRKTNRYHYMSSIRPTLLSPLTGNKEHSSLNPGVALTLDL